MRVLPGAAKQAERYGRDPVNAGFEFTAVVDPEEKAELLEEYEDDLETAGEPLPPELLVRLRKAPAVFGITVPGLTWSAAEFRSAWVASATLAEVTEGLLFDEWAPGPGHGYSDAAAALRSARERCDEAEAIQRSGSAFWNIRPFEGWDPA